MTQRIFVGTSTITKRYTDELGNADAQTTVTATATADDGTSLTLGSVTPGTTGVYTVTLACLVPTLVTLVWVADGVTSYDLIDVQGAPFITVAELIASDSTLANKSALLLAESIEDAEAECMSLTWRSWARRYTVEQLEVRSGRVQLSWPHVARIGRVSVTYPDGTTNVVTSHSLRGGGALEVPGAGEGDIVEVGYEHGLREAPREVRRALLIRARQLAQAPTSSVSMFTERVQVGDQYTTTRMLPKDGSTGVAEVDAAYRRNRYGGMGIA